MRRASRGRGTSPRPPAPPPISRWSWGGGGSGRMEGAGEPVTGIFDAHLVATSYLRLIVGLWGIESLVLIGAAWLLGGLARLRGLLPATLAAMAGGATALAAADLAVGFAAGGAPGPPPPLARARGP